MFKDLFKKKDKIKLTDKNILLAALLIHAAKIDENFQEKEKNIIKRALIDLNNINASKADEIIELAEKKESMDYKLKIIEILWKIVYSDGTNDEYESNLIRRVCGLLYVSDKESGVIKLKVKKLFN